MQVNFWDLSQLSKYLGQVDLLLMHSENRTEENKQRGCLKNQYQSGQSRTTTAGGRHLEFDRIGWRT